MKKICGIILAVLLIAGCSKDKEDAGKKTELPEGVAAIMYGEELPMEEVESRLNDFKKIQEQQGRTISEQDLEDIKPSILDSIIVKKLLLKKAEEVKVTLPEGKVEEEINSIKMNFESDEAFLADMTSKGYTLERLTSELSEDILIEELFKAEIEAKVTVEDEEVKKFYDDNVDTYFTKPETLRAAHILLKVEEDATEEKKEEILEEALRIKGEIDRGRDFTEAAMVYSQGPSRQYGGDLGEFQREQMVPEFSMAAFALEKDEVSEPVLTQFGYHIIKSAGISPASVQEFDDVKEQILQQLKNQKSAEMAQNYLKELKEAANLQIPEWAQPKAHSLDDGHGHTAEEIEELNK